MQIYFWEKPINDHLSPNYPYMSLVVKNPSHMGRSDQTGIRWKVNSVMLGVESQMSLTRSKEALPGPSVSLARRMLGDLARVFFDSDCLYNGILETCSFGWFFSGVSHYVSVCGEVSHCPFLHTSLSHPQRATELGQETDCSTEDCRGLLFVDFHSCYLPVLDTCTQLHTLHCNDMMDMDRNG